MTLKTGSRRMLLVLGALVLGGVLAHGLHERAQAAQEPPALVRVQGDTVFLPPPSAALLQFATVGQASPQRAELPGRLSWDEDHTARVLSPFAGRVAQILVKLGDTVKAGQPLALIYSPDFGAAQADARKAEAALQLAQRARARQEDLYAHGVAAARELEQAQADYASALAERERTRAQLKLVGDSREAVDQQFTLRSPVAGLVVERNLNPGQELRPDQPGVPLFVVTDPGSLWVLLDASEANAPQGLSRGASLQLRLSQQTQALYTAQLEDIADFFDPLTRTVKLRARFDNHQAQLRGGTYVTALLPAPPSQALAAPASTAFLLGQDYYVFVAGAQGYTRRKVQVSFNDQDQLLFVGGVQAGERLVSDGALFLERILEQQRDAQAASPQS